MIDTLTKDYKEGRLILFVGAGVSANLGLPDWSALISEIAGQLGFDADVYKTYGSSLELAEYYKLIKTKLGPLRSWMDVNWHSTKIDVKASKIHELIVKGNFSSIYTTNYDRWIEKAHDLYGIKYNKIVTVSDLVTADDNAINIIKFHGDFDDDNSIVLDETSYFERLDFESPLDIRLRSDILGKSVVFIGYSLTDINIRLLFYKLSKLWIKENNVSVKPKSYIFSSKPNIVQETILRNWGIEMITSAEDDREKALVDFLTELTS